MSGNFRAEHYFCRLEQLIFDIIRQWSDNFFFYIYFDLVLQFFDRYILSVVDYFSPFEMWEYSGQIYGKIGEMGLFFKLKSPDISRRLPE